jgi:hypothetical protein
VDPDSLNPDLDPDSAFQVNQDPDPIQIQCFDDKIVEKITAENFLRYFFRSKIAIYLSLSLHKERPSYRRSLQPSKGTTSHSQHEISLLFSFFVGHFFPPGSGSGSSNSN